MEPMMLTIPEAAAAAGLSRTKLYEYATEGRLTIKKAGKRSLIATSELRALLESLPAASIRCKSLTPAKAAPADA